MSAADPTAALAAYLLTTDVVSACSNRIFRPSLPKAEVAQMPRACVVIREAGGGALFGGGSLPMADPRIDFFCYGATDLEAQNLARSLCLALRALSRQSYESTMLHWARLSMRPVPLVDPQTAWPYSLVSAQVMHAEATV